MRLVARTSHKQFTLCDLPREPGRASMNMLTAARQMKHNSQDAVRFMLLRRRLTGLERTLRRGQTPSRRSIERLVHSWHNEAWSAGAALLAAVLTWLPRSTGP